MPGLCCDVRFCSVVRRFENCAVETFGEEGGLCFLQCVVCLVFEMRRCPRGLEVRYSKPVFVLGRGPCQNIDKSKKKRAKRGEMSDLLNEHYLKDCFIMVHTLESASFVYVLVKCFGNYLVWGIYQGSQQTKNV